MQENTLLEYPNNDKNLSTIMQNYYGTENYYTNDYLAFNYTDGVKAFCENAMAYWILDIVNSVVRTEKKMSEDLITIKLIVRKDSTATISFKDYEGTIYKQEIPFTDCPVGEWRFFYENGVFFWNGEY